MRTTRWEIESAIINKVGVLSREGDLLLEAGWEPFCVSDGIMYFRRLVEGGGEEKP